MKFFCMKIKKRKSRKELLENCVNCDIPKHCPFAVSNIKEIQKTKGIQKTKETLYRAGAMVYDKKDTGEICSQIL